MTGKITQFVTNILDEFNTVTKTPEDFLTSNKLSENLKQLLKKIYDFNKSDETLPQGKGLPELIIESFGHEELWAQLELENGMLYYKYLTEVSKVLQNASPIEQTTEAESLIDDEEQFSEKDESSDEEDENSVKENGEFDEKEEDDGDQSDHDSENLEDENAEEMSDEDGQQEKKDHFFDKKEMEKFLDDEDRKEMKKSDSKSKEEDDTSGAESEEDIDYFEDSDSESDSESKPIRYKDFFDAPQNTFSKSTNRNFNDSEDDSEPDFSDTGIESDKEEHLETLDNQPEQKSSFETRQERLKKKIGHLEAAALDEKPWQLKGETKADGRPQNSLLEEVLEFDVTARPNLVITEETNMQLEDVIIQRIKDKAWDSVKRKAKPVDDPLEFKKKLVLNQEKSKESLAQIYEKEFIEQREALDTDSANQPEQESADKIACTAKIDNLFSKLDTLSHFFFTPRIVKPDVKIISNLPAVNMEEVAPVGVSDATLLAPEEVRGKQKGELMSKDERTNTDKKRQRRAKKMKQRKRRLEEEAKALDPDLPKSKKAKKQLSTKLIKQVTKDRNVSKMAESGNTPGKSSEKFFRQLEDQVKNQIQKTVKNKKSKSDLNLNAKKLKL